ncbi:MAG: hypothetical protein WBC70_13305 [Candidatus Aminicenantales bacterium]
MGLKVSFGVLSCPDCGGALHYSSVSQGVDIFDARCLSCGKEWLVAKFPDGREEIREKTVS